MRKLCDAIIAEIWPFEITQRIKEKERCLFNPSEEDLDGYRHYEKDGMPEISEMTIRIKPTGNLSRLIKMSDKLIGLRIKIIAE